jgi:hypothetical protein
MNREESKQPVQPDTVLKNYEDCRSMVIEYNAKHPGGVRTPDEIYLMFREIQDAHTRLKLYEEERGFLIKYKERVCINDCDADVHPCNRPCDDMKPIVARLAMLDTMIAELQKGEK